MRKIGNIKVQDFLESNHIFPDYVINGVAYYSVNKEFKEVYDRYIITREMVGKKSVR